MAGVGRYRSEACGSIQSRGAIRKEIAEGGGEALSIVLAGNGGVGKSQLAAALARQARDRNRSEGSCPDLVLWTNASDPDQVITAYADAAERLGLTGSPAGDVVAAARAFLAWLPATERRWLVVLDDITDPAAVDPWWPDGSRRNGWVLATSRRHDALLSGQGRKVVDVGLYTGPEADAYVHRRLADAGHSHLYEPQAAAQLAEELGQLPLALGHAAAYMINKRCSAEDYVVLLRDTRNHLNDLLPRNADTEGYGRPVASSLLVSLTALQAADTTSLARPLLEFMALMDPVGHPADLWTTPPVVQHLSASWPGRRWMSRRRPSVTEQAVSSAVESLRMYALVAQDAPQEPIRLHALTARAVRESIPDRTLPVLARTAADAIASLWPDLDHHDRDVSAVLRANAMLLDHHSHPCLWKPTTHQCIYKVSMSLTAAGLYEQALAYDRGVFERNTEIHGPDHPDTLTSRSNLALSCRDAGRAHEALHLCEQVLADRERLLGPDHPDTLASRSNLALSYRDAGRAQEAIRLHERVLADRERLLGAGHPHTLASRSNLANSYRDAGRAQEAISLHQQILADVESHLGRDHPRALTSRSNLANSYRDAGRAQEAISLHQQILADVESHLGRDHPRALTSRSNLANSYRDAGRAQEAISLHQQVLTEREHALGPHHPDTLTSRNNLALSYRDAGRVQEAISLHEQVLTEREHALGSDHPDTLTSRSNLANSYRGAGRAQEAVSLHEQVIADHERILGPDHPHTLASRSNLALSYRDAGRVQEAISLHEQVLTERERILGPHHPDTLTSRNNLANSYRDAGRVQEAIRLHEQVLTERERVLGPDHFHTLVSRNNLANSYSDAGRTQQALELREQVLPELESLLGPTHPDTLTARSNLALSYRGAGRVQEAISLHEQVLTERESLLGPNHPDTLASRNNLTFTRNASDGS